MPWQDDEIIGGTATLPEPPPAPPAPSPAGGGWRNDPVLSPPGMAYPSPYGTPGPLANRNESFDLRRPGEGLAGVDPAAPVLPARIPGRPELDFSIAGTPQAPPPTLAAPPDPNAARSAQLESAFQDRDWELQQYVSGWLNGKESLPAGTAFGYQDEADKRIPDYIARIQNPIAREQLARRYHSLGSAYTRAQGELPRAPYVGEHLSAAAGRVGAGIDDAIGYGANQLADTLPVSPEDQANLRAFGSERYRAARGARESAIYVEQGLPQTPGGAAVTGAVRFALPLAASAVAGLVTRDPKLGAAVFTGMFSTESAANAYAAAIDRGANPTEAMEDARFSGIKAAIVSRIPMVWGPMAREGAAAQMANAFASGQAIATGDAAGDLAWKRVVRGEKISDEDWARLSEAVIQSGPIAAGLHGTMHAAGELPGMIRDGTPANSMRTAEAPLRRSPGDQTPGRAPGDYPTAPGMAPLEPPPPARGLAGIQTLPEPPARVPPRYDPRALRDALPAERQPPQPPRQEVQPDQRQPDQADHELPEGVGTAAHEGSVPEPDRMTPAERAAAIDAVGAEPAPVYHETPPPGLKKGPEEAAAGAPADLHGYADTLFHEGSPRDIGMELRPNARPQGTMGYDLYTSNTPDLATGQGESRGVTVEMDPKGLEGTVNTRKPSWRFAYEQGSAEFVSHVRPGELAPRVRAVTVAPGVADPILTTQLHRLRGKGWTQTANADGSTTYRRPEAPAKAPHALPPAPDRTPEPPRRAEPAAPAQATPPAAGEAAGTPKDLAGKVPQDDTKTPGKTGVGTPKDQSGYESLAEGLDLSGPRSLPDTLPDGTPAHRATARQYHAAYHDAELARARAAGSPDEDLSSLVQEEHRRHVEAAAAKGLDVGEANRREYGIEGPAGVEIPPEPSKGDPQFFEKMTARERALQAAGLDEPTLKAKDRATRDAATMKRSEADAKKSVFEYFADSAREWDAARQRSYENRSANDPAKPKAPPKPNLSRADVERRLLEHYDQTAGHADAERATRAHDAGQATGGGATVFRAIPKDLRERFTGPEWVQVMRRRIVRVAKPGEHTGGEDAISESGMGIDRYEQMVRDRLDGTDAGKLRRAVEAGHNSEDPAVRFLAAVHDALAPAKGEKATPYEARDADSLKPGQAFEFQGEKFRVTEDEMGMRVLQDGGTFPEVPLDFLDKVPVDKGTLTPAKGAKFFDPAAEGIKSGEQAGVFGQPVYDAGTGAQRSMFGDTRPAEAPKVAESKEDARARRVNEGDKTQGELPIPKPSTKKAPPAVTVEPTPDGAGVVVRGAEQTKSSSFGKEGMGGTWDAKLGGYVVPKSRADRARAEAGLINAARERNALDPEDAPPPVTYAPKSAGPSMKPTDRAQRGGFVTLPDVGRAVGYARKLRERFSLIEKADSPELASALTRHVNAGAEAETWVRNFEREAFADAPDKAKAIDEFRAIGWNNRAKLARAKGLPATGIPTLTAAEEAAIRAKPYIREAIKVWNRDVAPEIDAIRTRNRLPMDPNAGTVDLFLNLPSDGSPAKNTRAGVNLDPAFATPMTGEGEYKSDPRETLVAIVRGHLRTDYSRDVARAIRSGVSIDPADVVDPNGALNPTAFPVPRSGDYFEAPYKGHTEQVAVVDLAPSDKPPELHYVPRRVAEAMNKQRQSEDPHDAPADALLNGYTRLGLIGDFAPHTLRVLYQVAGRMGQSGQNAASVVPWLGSIPAAVYRLHQMGPGALGDAWQLVVDRAGANRGAGYGLKDPTGTLAKIADLPHRALMDPASGIDPRARRAVADAHARMALGNRLLGGIEADLAAGRLTPSGAAARIQSALGADGMQSLGRRVNATMGFSNKQTRSNLLNGLQRFLPFLSSESGMIPDEIRKVLTLNLNMLTIHGNVRRGEYGRAMVQAAAQLATGAAGSYLMLQALNYTLNGHGMEDNERGRRTELKIGGGWYSDNLDPTFSRATRLIGAKAAANGDGTLESVTGAASLEAINEAFAVLNPAIRTGFTALTATFGKPKSLHVSEDARLTNASAGWWWPAGVGRETIKELAGDDGDAGKGAIRDAVGFLTGTRLKEAPSPELNAKLDRRDENRQRRRDGLKPQRGPIRHPW